MKTTQSLQIFPKERAKIVRGILIDPILNFLERADRELSENVYFYPFCSIVFELWLFVLRHVETHQITCCGPSAMLSRFTIKCAKHYASNWFNYFIVCPFRAKSGKCYSKTRGKLMQLGKERTAIALRLCLIRGKLQQLQTSVNIL